MGLDVWEGVAAVVFVDFEAQIGAKYRQLLNRIGVGNERQGRALLEEEEALKLPL